MEINNEVIEQAKAQKKYLRSIGQEVPTFINDIINNSSLDVMQINFQNTKMPSPDAAPRQWGGHYLQNDIPGLASLPNYFNEFNAGGKHETNPNGGVPIGNGNTVEEGETSADINGGKFIFSDRVFTDGKTIPYQGNQMALGGNPDPKRKHPDQEYISVDRYLEGRDRVSNYIGSEGYLNLLRKNYPNPEKIQKDRLNNVKDIFVNRTAGINQGAYYSKKHPDNSENKLEVPSYGNKDIVEHEYLHAATDGQYGMTSLEKQRIAERIKKDPNRDNYRGIGLKPYFERPEEFQARLGVTRMLLQENGFYDFNKGKFTKEHLDKLRKDMKKNPDRWNIQGLYDVLDMSKSDEDLIWLMNNIANNTNKNGTRYIKTV